MKRFFSGLFITLFFLLLIIGFHKLLYRLADKQGLFQIDDIIVEGNNLARDKDIIRYSGVLWDEPIFSVNLLQAAAATTAHPLVETATVKRIPPTTIKIIVEENNPVAIVGDDDDNFVCDDEGNILDVGIASGVTLITVDYDVSEVNGKINDDFIIALMGNLYDFSRKSEIMNIVVKQDEGTYIILSALPDTLFYIGLRISDEDYLNRVVAIGDQIIDQGLDISYVDVTDTSGIGFQ